MISLLRLPPGEPEAVADLAAFQVAHPDVKILTPHYHDEPWRAEIREGSLPGETRTTSAFLTARHPSELLRKLEKLFAGSDPEADTG